MSQGFVGLRLLESLLHDLDLKKLISCNGRLVFCCGLCHETPISILNCKYDSSKYIMVISDPILMQDVIVGYEMQLEGYIVLVQGY